MISRKFAYADDLTLLHSSGNWKDLEGTSSQDVRDLSKPKQFSIITKSLHLIADIIHLLFIYNSFIISNTKLITKSHAIATVMCYSSVLKHVCLH